MLKNLPILKFFVWGLILFIIPGLTVSDEVLHVLTGHAWSVTDIEINSKGDLLLSGSWDKTMKLWSLPDKKVIFTFTGHDEMIWEVAFSRNEQYVASCSWDGSINVWDIRTKERVRKFKHQPKFEQIRYEPFYEKRMVPDMCNTLDFSPENRFIAGGSSDGMIRIWDISTGKLADVINIHDSLSVNKVKFTGAGDQLISASDKIKVYDLKTHRITKILDGHQGAGICAMDLDKTWKYLITGDIAPYHPLIICWDLEKGDSIRVFRGHRSIIRDICFSNDAGMVASVGEDNLIKIWNLKSGKPLKTMTDGDGKELNTICFTTDDRQIIYGSQDKTIKIRDISGIRK